jgi:alkylhydroperoxidase family enzyme
MPKVPYRDAGDPAIAELVAAIRARRGGKLLNLDRMLLVSPPYARGWNALLGAVRRELELSLRIRELTICAVAKLNRAAYEWRQHAPEFLAAGGRADQLDALADVEAACSDARFDDAERAALKLTVDMTRAVEVQPQTFARARALFSDRELVELVGTIATYNMVSRLLVALDVTPDGE